MAANPTTATLWSTNPDFKSSGAKISLVADVHGAGVDVGQPFFEPPRRPDAGAFVLCFVFLFGRVDQRLEALGPARAHGSRLRGRRRTVVEAEAAGALGRGVGFVACTEQRSAWQQGRARERTTCPT